MFTSCCINILPMFLSMPYTGIKRAPVIVWRIFSARSFSHIKYVAKNIQNVRYDGPTGPFLTHQHWDPPPLPSPSALMSAFLFFFDSKSFKINKKKC